LAQEAECPASVADVVVLLEVILRFVPRRFESGVALDLVSMFGSALADPVAR
jgi:hypothetical protein